MLASCTSATELRISDMRELGLMMASTAFFATNTASSTIPQATMTNYLLALNCGSSSLKTTLFSYPALEQICSISASSIGSSEATLKSSFQGQKYNKSVTDESHSEIFSDVLQELKRLDGGKLVSHVGQIKIVTHRIVHGGTLDNPVRVSQDNTDALEKMEQVSSLSRILLSALCQRAFIDDRSRFICNLTSTAIRICTSAQSSCRPYSESRVGKTTRSCQLLLFRYTRMSPVFAIPKRAPGG
jgi:hypothetical protein